MTKRITTGHILVSLCANAICTEQTGIITVNNLPGMGELGEGYPSMNYARRSGDLTKGVVRLFASTPG